MKLLYGNRSVDDASNTPIFNVTIDFLLVTKRIDVNPL